MNLRLIDIRKQYKTFLRFEELKTILEKENVKAVSYGISMVEYSDGSIPAIVCEDFLALENNIAYSGRHPETANEIAIGNAFAADYEIGDTFTLTQSGSKYAYTVTGYIQSVNNSGFIAEITDEGYANISNVPLYSLNLYMDENAEILIWAICMVAGILISYCYSLIIGVDVFKNI